MRWPFFHPPSHAITLLYDPRQLSIAFVGTRQPCFVYWMGVARAIGVR